MTIRSEALKWLANREVRDGHIVASKYYLPDESWTKGKAWWLQIPLSALREHEIIHLVCQSAPGKTSFRHLAVPATFFAQHCHDFALLAGDKINLFLAAQERMEFQDQRGPGRISFAKFEQSDDAA
jgi:hypothetical protein